MTLKRYFVFPMLVLAIACGNNTPSDNTTDKTGPKDTKDYTVLKIYPHDPASFTEGFYLKGTQIYESTGEAESKLLVYDLASGKLSQTVNLDKQYFGEGISELDGKIYQLTWQNHKVFVYDAKTLQKVKEMSWPLEGWGMTTDGKDLIISVGSSIVYYVNPADFSVIKTINVSNNYGPLSMINELEYVDGFIYANVWQTKSIVKIDPKTGNVLQTIDLTDIREKSGVAATGGDLNGIAYDSDHKSFLITGKNWSNTFEIKIK